MKKGGKEERKEARKEERKEERKEARKAERKRASKPKKLVEKTSCEHCVCKWGLRPPQPL